MENLNAVEGAVVENEVATGAAVEDTATVAVVEADDESRVSLEDFITAWENAVKSNGGVDEVAKVLDLKKESVQARASKYRTEYNIPLSNMRKGGGAKIDKAKDLELLAKLRGQDLAKVTAVSVQLAADKATRVAEREAAKAEKAAAEAGAAEGAEGAADGEAEQAAS